MNTATVKIFYNAVLGLKDADEMTNSVEPDQEQSDLGLHFLSLPSYLNIHDFYAPN